MKRLIQFITSSLKSNSKETKEQPKLKKGKLSEKERLEGLNQIFTGGRTDEYMLKVEAGCQTIADFFGLEYKCSSHNPYMWSWNYVFRDSEKCGRNPEGKIGEIFMPQKDWGTLMPYIAFFNDEELNLVSDDVKQSLAEALVTNDCEKAFFAVVEMLEVQKQKQVA